MGRMRGPEGSRNKGCTLAVWVSPEKLVVRTQETDREGLGLGKRVWQGEEGSLGLFPDGGDTGCRVTWHWELSPACCTPPAIVGVLRSGLVWMSNWRGCCRPGLRTLTLQPAPSTPRQPDPLSWCGQHPHPGSTLVSCPLTYSLRTCRREVRRHLWVRPPDRPSIHHQASGCSPMWERRVSGKGPRGRAVPCASLPVGAFLSP